jgi:hypothetical protein
MTIGDSIGAETTFFSSHSVWQRVDPRLVGVEALKGKLVRLLEVVVTNGLSGVLQEIDEQMESKVMSLDSLGQSMESAAERRSVFSAAVEAYTRLLDDAVTGKYRGAFFKIAEPSEDEPSMLVKGTYIFLMKKTIVFAP